MVFSGSIAGQFGSLDCRGAVGTFRNRHITILRVDAQFCGKRFCGAVCVVVETLALGVIVMVSFSKKCRGCVGGRTPGQ